MEKVSAMKKVALFLMIVGLAVALVACQGAVGPKGDKGDDGADGVDGTAGTAGTDAFQPLSPKAESPSVVINDATDEDDMVVAGAAQTIDLADYIRGTADRTYGTPTTVPMPTLVFDAKIEGSMLTITPKEPQPNNGQYNVETFTVMISDGGESTAIPLEIPARRNQKPVTPQTDGMGTVGTQAPAMAPDSVAVCPALGECYVDVIFTDPDRPSGAAATNTEKLSFTATSADTSKVEVVSVGNGIDGSDASQPLVARVVVKGVASTFDAEANPMTGMVEVTIVATDEGGATVRGTANITVDGAPTADPLPDGTVSQGATTNTYTFDASGFFEDPEAENLDIAAEMTEATAKFASVAVIGSDVTVTRKAPGSAVVTVTATEQGSAPQQSVKGTFTVTVN